MEEAEGPRDTCWGSVRRPRLVLTVFPGQVAFLSVERQDSWWVGDRGCHEMPEIGTTEDSGESY